MRRQSAEKQLENLTATYSEMLESRQEIIAQNERLRSELQRITKLGEQPDYQAVRDRILKTWRTAKAPEKKERIAEALDRFIEELTKG